MHTCLTPRTVARTSTNEAVLARSMRSWVRNAPMPDWRRRSSDAEPQVAEAQVGEAEREGRPGPRERGVIRGHRLGLAELTAKVTPHSGARKPAPGVVLRTSRGGCSIDSHAPSSSR